MKSFLQKALLRNRSHLYVRTTYFLNTVTLVSILAISLETVSELSAYSKFFDYFEYVVVFIFTIEFLARLYAKEEKFRYLYSLYGLIDILAILPTYFGMFNFTFLKAARIVRLLKFLRMSRIAKLSRLNKFSNSNSKKAQEIRIISIKIYILTLFAAMILFGSTLYFVEGEVNVLFQDIPSAVLWSAMALLGGGINSELLSLPAKVLVVLLQFTSLLLFGLLIAIVGHYVEKKLLGSSQIDR